MNSEHQSHAMITDPVQRLRVSSRIAEAISDVVRDQYRSGMHEEPDITSRIAQKLEDRLNGKQAGGHRFGVVAQTVTSHGGKSLEKRLGTDLYIVISVKKADGETIKKGILVQAKRADKLSSELKRLRGQCGQMTVITKKGSIVWIYGSDGVVTMKASDVEAGSLSSSPLTEMFNEVFLCNIGDKRKVPGGDGIDRAAVGELLKKLGARTALLMQLKQIQQD